MVRVWDFGHLYRVHVIEWQEPEELICSSNHIHPRRRHNGVICAYHLLFIRGGDKLNGLARSRELYAERWAGLLPASCCAPISAITVSLVLSSRLQVARDIHK